MLFSRIRSFVLLFKKDDLDISLHNGIPTAGIKTTQKKVASNKKNPNKIEIQAFCDSQRRFV